MLIVIFFRVSPNSTSHTLTSLVMSGTSLLRILSQRRGVTLSTLSNEATMGLQHCIHSIAYNNTSCYTMNSIVQIG
jgi:hypothetical protein